MAPHAVVQHQRDLVLEAQEHAAQVDAEDPVPLGLGEVGQWLGVLLDAGVVERDVEVPERLDGLVECRLDLVGRGDVAAHGEGASAGLVDQPSRFVVVLLGHVGDDHAGALAGERECRGAADTGRGAGDEGDLAGEPAVVVGHGRLSLPETRSTLGGGGQGWRRTLIARRESMAR
jgi:hypothetical protein